MLQRTGRQALLGWAVGAAIAVPPAGADELVSVGTHRLEVRREGAGSPVVVIDTGLGDRMDKVAALQDLLAPHSVVLTYNRAGYGRSEPGPPPRDAGREADDLQSLLDAVGVPKPYVLVGHSLGALNVQVLASRHPTDVAGMVLIDPPPLSFILRKEYTDLLGMADQATAEWQRIADAGADSEDPERRAEAAFFRTIASEHRETFGGTSAQLVAAIPDFGSLPLVVIAAGKPNPQFGEVADEYQRYWIEQCRALAKKSAKGRFLLAEQASHHVYLDALKLVTDEILALVQNARDD
jgi:pimeloyl-ACP methyl ester carboxylesterase